MNYELYESVMHYLMLNLLNVDQMFDKIPNFKNNKKFHTIELFY